MHMSEHTHVQTHIHTHTLCMRTHNTCTNTHNRCTYIHMHTHTHTHMHTHTCTMNTYIAMHAYIMYSYSYPQHTDVHTCTCSYTYAQHMWLDFGKPTIMSHLAYSILLAQLIATLIQHPCTVALPGLADWSAFLEQVLPPIRWSHNWDNGTHGGL